MIKIYQDIAVCDGKSKTILVDLSKNKMYEFKNHYNFLLNELKIGKAKEEIKESDLLTFLFENDLIFESNLHENFEELSDDFDSQNSILNTIVLDIDSIDFDYYTFVTILEKCLCQNLFIYFNIEDFHFLNKFIKSLSHSCLQFIEICVKFNNNIEEYIKNISKSVRVKRIYVWGCGFSKIDEMYEDFCVIYSQEKIHGREIKPKQFSFALNLDSYIESKNYNLYYNKKLYFNSNLEVRVSRNGIIILTYSSHFIPNLLTKIKEGIDLWLSSKERTKICNVCEFRRFCQDSRVPVKNIDGSWEMTSECNYNPILGLWKDDNP
jgi:hypothetical protein